MAVISEHTSGFSDVGAGRQRVFYKKNVILNPDGDVVAHVWGQVKVINPSYRLTQSQMPAGAAFMGQAWSEPPHLIDPTAKGPHSGHLGQAWSEPPHLIQPTTPWAHSGSLPAPPQWFPSAKSSSRAYVPSETFMGQEEDTSLF